MLRLRGKRNGAYKYKKVIIRSFEVKPKHSPRPNSRPSAFSAQLYVVRIGVMILSFLSRLTFSSATLKAKIKAKNKVKLD